MIAGLPGVGLGSLFYAVLLVGMGVSKLYQAVVKLARRYQPPPPELQPAVAALAGESDGPAPTRWRRKRLAGDHGRRQAAGRLESGAWQVSDR
jgi:hypothetical protein